jgi:hypothetical protein
LFCWQPDGAGPRMASQTRRRHRMRPILIDM